jgi:hypothetical protein
MPIGEIASEVLGGILRFVAQIVLEVVFELLIKGPGYLLYGLFKKDASPDGALVAMVGMVFWACVAAGAWFAYRHAS